MQERQCLYHFPICPFCREIRFLLELNDVKNCSLRIENFWEKREKFLNINPTGDVPFLAVQKIDENDERKSLLIWGKNAIVDYLRKKYPVHTLLKGNIEEQANIMKYSELFDTKFYEDVVRPIINERVYVFYKKKRTSDVNIIKVARINCREYLSFVESILKKRDYIAGGTFSFADLSLACQISSLDYLGEIDWQAYPILKEWYMPIKSKPAFRDILYDIIPDFRPSVWYRELDF